MIQPVYELSQHKSKVLDNDFAARHRIVAVNSVNICRVLVQTVAALYKAAIELVHANQRSCRAVELANFLSGEARTCGGAERVPA